MAIRRSRTIGLLLLAVVTLGALAVSPLSAVRSRELRGTLFAESRQPIDQARPADRTVVRSRLVSIDTAALLAARPTDPNAATRPSLLLNLFDDLAYNVIIDRVDPAEGGYTLVGHIPGYPMSTVTLVTIGNVVAGSIVMPQAVYAIRHVGGGVHEVAQIDQSKFLSELEPLETGHTNAVVGAGRDRAGPTLMGDDGSTIDLLVLYTPAAAAAAGGQTEMAALIEKGKTDTNTSYLNSGVTQRLRLVHSQLVTYSENNNLATDLFAVGNYDGSVISTPLGNLAAALRDTYGADLVMLVTYPNNPNGCGISWMVPPGSDTSWAPYGFSVVEQSCISTNFTFAHELGHNMGARHDWYVDNSTSPNTYSHGYVDPPNHFRTVMSYADSCLALPSGACTRVLYWSNPAVVSPGAYGSAPMGIPEGTKSDCPMFNPFNMACDADDHRTLNSTALNVANFRSAPSITTQPISQTVRAGLTATFSAGARANPAPTVQWQVSTNSGVSWSDIGGAASTTLAFAASIAYNARQYRAIFTNQYGSATTNAATLGVPPSIATQPSNTTAQAGSTVSFSAAASSSPSATLQWQVSVDGGATFTNIVGATVSPYTFTAAAASHNNRYRAVFTNTAGSTPTNAAKLTIVSAINVSPTLLIFGATKAGAGGALGVVTAAQTITLTFGGAANVWTATPNQTWLQVTGGSGTGLGQFTVSIVNPGNVIGGTTSLLGSVTVASATAPNTPVSIPVTLTVDQTAGAATLPPIGVVDTPVQNATGQVGAIAVTGWVVDDIGVSWVRLYRNCLAFEPAANCAVANGLNVVYLGDATLVSGARPDIEAAYPTYPQNDRAGWGYMLLTSMLPHIPNHQMFGGQGQLTMYVLAQDLEGHQRWLGRDYITPPTLTDQVPTVFTMANDTIAKPFGAIDTPTQGQTVAGAFYNFGWTLTPDVDTVAGTGDILMPLTGATQWVYIDGTPVAPIGYYNLCRGTVGSPVPAGLYCDDDVASIFGNATPQPLNTLRSSNPTKYRNLDAGRGPQGAYWLDTTLLSNGIHTIVWGVSDSDGRGEGIGSRYFWVLNGSADASSPGSSFDSRAPGTTFAQDKSDPGSRISAEDALRSAPAQSRGDARALDALQPAAGDVWVRTGFDVGALFDTIAADGAGVRHVQIPVLGRLEVWLGAVEGGYLVANGTLRDLPPGSRLDPATGQFTWAPGVGYFGTYRLAFVRGGEQLIVEVTIRPNQ